MVGNSWKRLELELLSERVSPRGTCARLSRYSELPVRAMAASLLEVGDGWRKYLWTATMLVTTFTPFHSVPSRRHLRSA